jgi:hypothetical protein
MARLNIMCDGDTCAVVGAELRCYPFPGFTLTLCEPCFQRQGDAARLIAAATSIPDLWPILEWESAEPYKYMERQKNDTL